MEMSHRERQCFNGSGTCIEMNRLVSVAGGNVYEENTFLILFTIKMALNVL